MLSTKITRRKFLLLLGDILWLYLALTLVIAWRYGSLFNFKIWQEHLFFFSFLFLFALAIFYAFGFYNPKIFRFPLIFYKQFFLGQLIFFILGVAFFYFISLPTITPKTNLFLTVVLSSLFLLAWRKIFLKLFSNYFQSKTLILGQGEEVEKLKKELEENPCLGYQIVSLNSNEDILTKVKKEEIETIIVTNAYLKDENFLKIFYQCLPYQVQFLDFSTAYEMVYGKIPLLEINEHWFLENLKEGDKIFYDRLKRILDIFLSLLILFLTLPLWLLIALAIKLDDHGPVFYQQERVGKNKKTFFLIKFRSMIPQAEINGPQWAEKEDKRVTRVGKILRKLHLDELPQMINILKGDISFIGPRPERPKFVQELEKEIPYYHLRHLIKPGFTGWAQVEFRYARSIADSFEKFQYDLFYLKNRSLFLDFKIIFKTLAILFRGE